MFTARLENDKNEGIIQAKDLKVGDIAIVVDKYNHTDNIVVRIPYPNNKDRFFMVDLTNCNCYWDNNDCSLKVKVLPKGAKVTINAL